MTEATEAGEKKLMTWKTKIFGIAGILVLGVAGWALTEAIGTGKAVAVDVKDLQVHKATQIRTEDESKASMRSLNDKMDAYQKVLLIEIRKK